MIGSNIAKRYARALFDIAVEEDRLERYSSEIGSFSLLIGGNKGLQEFLANPIFDESEKKAVIAEIARRINLSAVTANFLNLLIDKGRIGILSEIEKCYRQLVDNALKKVRVTVKTALPLSAELAKRLEENLEKVTGKKVEMAIEEDRSLLGGIVVGIGDKRYDGSIRTQLNNMRNLLREEI